MFNRITHTTVVVSDQDEALSFYVDKLGFEKHSDAPMGPKERWVTVNIPGDDLELVLMAPDWYTEDQEVIAYRKQLIGRNSVVVAVDDCRAAYETLRERGVLFAYEPTERDYGIEAVAKDPFGNDIVIIQARALA
ncbi:MAG: glyoxalase [Chloroflexaceae bacterium]|nr:glyoxalase [Chloroflexaceae bacterium]NJO05229.1 glyoxalase [Chloroflexaceae bacterium]